MPDLKPTPISDEAEIIAAIREETEAFHSMDIDRWMACWINSERALETMVDDDMGLITNRGATSIRAANEKAMRDGINCDAVAFSQENHQVSIDRDMAWVIFDGTTTTSKGAVNQTFETRIMERENGLWKIAYLGFMHKRPIVGTGDRIAVDAKGRVAWASETALERLNRHPGLTVSAGQLRARRPSWDKPLQEALRHASELHGFFHQMEFLQENDRAYRCPVVLGENDDGGLVTCVLTVRDGMTYVDIGGEERLDERLSSAVAVFGLSPGQIALVRQIMSGESLTKAAESMDISVNTARTHLTRIYDKTGVNSQTALVRLLLSVG